jgi:hypothetical protein
MSKKELQEMKEGLRLQQKDQSKKEAKRLLLDLRLITPKGNPTTVFKPVKK